MTLKEWERRASRELRKIVALLGRGERGMPRNFGGPLTVEVKMVRRPQMVALNGKYRRKHKPTDILSFESPEVFRRAGHLGELVICAPVMREQALAMGHPVEVELLVLLVHGVLHLLGWDHERSPKESRAMAQREELLLRKLLPRKFLDRQAGLILRRP